LNGWLIMFYISSQGVAHELKWTIFVGFKN